MFRVRSLAESSLPGKTTAGGFASELTTRSGLGRTAACGAENAIAEAARETTSATAITWKRMARAFPERPEAKRRAGPPRPGRSRLGLRRSARPARLLPEAHRTAAPRPPLLRPLPPLLPRPPRAPPRPRLLPQL